MQKIKRFLIVTCRVSLEWAFEALQQLHINIFDQTRCQAASGANSLTTGLTENA